MKLTQSQNRRVQRYVREVGRHMDGVTGEARDAALSRLRQRIDDQLRRLQVEEPEDEQVEAVLQRCGAPHDVARHYAGTEPNGAGGMAGDRRVWLGVCAAASDQFGIDVRYVRAGAVLVGLVLPLLPFVLLAYLASYAVLRYTADLPGARPVDRWGLVKVVGGVFAALLALHVVALLALEGFRRALFLLLQIRPELTGDWAWLAWRGDSLFTWALLLTLPVAALSALPVPQPWARTLRKVAYALIAVYAVALCFGLACYFVGTAVALASDFEGIPAVSNLI